MQTVDFFFYGTLQDEEVRRAVFGLAARHDPLEAGRLDGHRAAPGPSGCYPILVQDPDRITDGLIVPAVDLVAAARVSFFESEGYEYEPLLVTVETAAGLRPAWAYLAGPSARPEPGEWSYSTWRTRHRADFLRGARIAMRACTGRRASAYRQAWARRLAAADRTMRASGRS